MHHDFPDLPDIRNTILTGYPDGKDNSNPICPVCGSETDRFYKNSYGDIVGCEECIVSVDAWEEMSDEPY